MKAMLKHRRDRQGFTIIEALIALAIFSFILVIFTLTFVQINRLFAKGQTIKNMNETGRRLIEDIAQNTRLNASGGEITIEGAAGGTTGRICLTSGVTYSWQVRQGMGDSFINRDAAGNACDGTGDLDQAIQNSGEVNFLGEGVDLRLFSVSPKFHEGEEVGVSIEFLLSTGPDDLFDGLAVNEIESMACAGTIDAGRQFCDVVSYSTFVSYRN